MTHRIHRYLLRIAARLGDIVNSFTALQVLSLEEKTEESDENWHLPVLIHRTSATLKFLHAHSRESVATFIRCSKVQIAGPIVENYNLGVRYHDAHAVHTVHKCTFCPFRFRLDCARMLQSTQHVALIFTTNLITNLAHDRVPTIFSEIVETNVATC